MFHTDIHTDIGSCQDTNTNIKLRHTLPGPTGKVDYARGRLLQRTLKKLRTLKKIFKVR